MADEAEAREKWQRHVRYLRHKAAEPFSLGLKLLCCEIWAATGSEAVCSAAVPWWLSKHQSPFTRTPSLTGAPL